MEVKDIEAELTRLNSEVKHLNTKIDKDIASLREELKRQILLVHLTQIRDLTLSLLMPNSFVEHRKAYDGVIKVTNKYFEELKRAPLDEFEKGMSTLKKEINAVVRVAGFGEIWEMPKD